MKLLRLKSQGHQSEAYKTNDLQRIQILKPRMTPWDRGSFDRSGKRPAWAPRKYALR